MLGLGCSSAAIPPEWYDSPPRCDGCYQGVGEGRGRDEARRNAMARLCESIRVVVTSEWKSEESHRLQETTREGLVSSRVDFAQAVGSIARMTARCDFEGLPFVEDPKPERSGDRMFVRLVLSGEAYARYLRDRVASIVVESGDVTIPDGDRRTIENQAAGCLGDLGYLPATTAGQTPFKLTLTMSLHISETGVQGLKAATSTPSVRLEETGSGRIVWQKNLESVTVHGFEDAGLVSDSVKQMAAKLSSCTR